MKNILKRTISFLLAANMALSGAVPALAFELEKIGEEISFSETETVETAENPWEGKSAVFVGDSITAGSGTTKKYYEYLDEALGFGSVTGMGVGGSCFSLYSDYGTKNQPLMSRYQNIPSADLIVVFMGTNDYGHETPLGTIDDTKDGTFYGALNVIIPALVAKHTASKIVFATPIHRYGAGTSGILGTKFTYDNIPNGVGATLEDYADAIKEVCEENDVTVIDLFTECPIDPTDAEVREEFIPDGIHPNAAGHEVLAEIMEEHIRGYEPVEVDPEDLTEIIHGNKFAALGDENRASSRINYYLKAGTVITLNDPETFQWACAKTDGENSSKNLGYFPEKQWTDIATATVEADGWIGFTFKYRDETKAFDLSRPLSDFITIEEPEIEDPKALRGKTLSILGASISTYAGTSNGAAADTTNSTIRNNAKYYPNNTVKDVALGDTWWMQFADDLGLRLLVNNSWSGGAILLERAGTVGAYVDRCVQLHDNTGENAGEDPDIIIIQKGFNDFSYGKSTLGTAEDINYEELILEDGYAEPKTTMEATVIMLDKMTKRYPDAEIYMFSHFKRVNQSAADTELMEKLNSSIETVCERYGIKVIDLYSVLGSVEFVGDGSLHPNRLGMDIMTEAAKRTVLANTAYEAETHLVSFELEGVSADYGDDKIVISGDSFSVNLAAEIAGILEVSVTMGGKDITEAAYKDGKVSIEAVTGDVVIKAESVHEPKDYCWESDGTDLVCISGENDLKKISGTTAGGVFSKTVYSLEEPVVLLHDKPWTVEWKCEGTFMNENGSTGARIFTSDNINANYNARYIFKSATKWLIAMGEKDSSGSHNYGIALEDHGIDGSALHTYRLENRIASDGSNMVYLFVDGKEIGALNNYYVGTTDKGTTSDWLSGKDFVFPYMGTDTHGFSNAKIDCIAVWENGEKTEPLSLRYDDRYDVSGKTVEIVDAGKPTSYKVGYGVAEGTFDDAVITLSGEKLITTGIGTAKVRIDGILYEITVEAAPISLFMITGHSMGAGQAGSKTESVVGPDGQVYSSHGTTNLSASTEGTGISFAAQTKANGINAFTEEGEGTIGEGSAFAWKWNMLTGEKVWVLNTAVGGSNLKEWIPGATNYKNAVNQYKRAQEILSNEIKAGHYVLSDMGIFYHNGANFSYKGVTFTQADLKNWYDSMWGGFKNEFSRDMDGNGTKETVSFLGIVPIWTKSGGQSYTQDEPAAMFMAASAEYDDIFTVSVIGKEWLTDADVSALFPEIDYKIQSGAVLKRPVKSSEVFASDNVHYKQVGYNAVGIDIAENLYEYLKGENELSEVKLVYPETLGEIEDNTELVYGEELIIVPLVEPITYSGLEFAAEGIVEISYPLATKATGNGTGKLIVSSGGKVIKELNFVCSSKPEALSLRYDDRYDVSGKTVEIVDAGKPTSYKVGYGVAEGTLDDAVIALSGEKLIATGIGTAKVRIDGVLYEITVEASPISLLLLIGQSNMRGSEGNANQSIVCPEGVVYATYGDDRGADNTAMSKTNARFFAPSALAGEYSSINVEGTTECLSGYPVYSLNEAGAGKIGPDSGFGYEWAKQTGEKVWIVNAAHGGTSINAWQDGGKEFEECEALFKACQETLQKEIAAGHFTLSHMAYFWCQGCSDAANTAEQYAKKYLSMHESLKTVLAFDHDSDSATKDYTFEFGGIIPVRAGNATSACYREGIYKDTTTAKYHESFKDLRFTGPRVAQYWMINNPELPDIWGVCNIGEDWVWMPDGTNGVSDYFNAHYENGRVDYETQVAQKESWYTPTTPAAVHDSIHYNQIGYNEVGRESVRNALIMLGEIKAPETETTVELLSWNGYTEVSEVPASTTGNSGTLVVPKVYPLWEAKNVEFKLSEGLQYVYYDLIADSAEREGTLSTEGKTVSVVKAEPGAHYKEHLSTLPEKVCSGLNLWNVLPHDEYYFETGTNWGKHSSGNVYSVTIPVEAGERIFATSFGKAVENGHASSNGIRTTFFSAYGVAKTMTPAECYAEFSKNGGYLVAPEGATAINVAMWSDSSENELYILSAKHDTDSGICGICGKDSHTHEWSEWKMKEIPGKGEPVTEERTCSGCGETETREVESVWQKYNLAAHYSDLPEKVCSGLNLWNVLEHDDEFITAGTHWAVHSTGKVYSVTFAVNGGDRIYATSFGKAGENGGSSNGIRMTFLDAYGMLKTLDPAGTYAEFTANGGYLVAPEGAIAVNIPMWNNSDENEIYLLDREHSFGEWSITTQPTPDSNGIEQRSCSVCGYYETREFEGVWQKYKLGEHLLELPEHVCSDLNLWPILPHEDVHFTSGKTWGKTGTPVTSITIPVSAGDRLYATSWNKAGENGHETVNGIRVTFFDAYGIALTLGPGESDRKFAANGGYLEAPEGTIAINIAMWYDSEDYEVYILSREHVYDNVTVEPTCTEEGYSGYLCLACGAGEKTIVPALGHDIITHSAKAATCTESGWNAYETCSGCDYTTYEEIPAAGHSFGEWTEVKAPTCDAEGQDKSVCGTCGETIFRDTRISGGGNKILVSNPLPENYYEGKTFLAIGDSLTNGTGVEKDERYHSVFAQKLGGTNINGGTSGATLCPGGHLPNKFEALMTADFLKKKNVDVVTIFLGINDWDNGVLNGTYQGVLKYDENATYYDLGEFGTDDTATIYGAAKMWCERILEIKATEGCEDIQFMFATPVITSYNKSVTNKRDWNQDKLNVFGHTLREYCTAIMEVCEYYEIPVLDLNMYSGMYYNSETDNNVDYFGGDGIHPGKNGHAMMADAFVEFLLEGYSYEERAVADCGHSYVDEVVAPSCEEEGYTIHRCPECHNRYIDSYVPAAGHSFGEWTEVKAPACDAEGQDKSVCGSCGNEKYRKTFISGDSGKILVSNSLPEDYFAGKKIVTLGDSVTFGAFLDSRYTEAYPFVLGELLGATISNKAISGSCFCTGGKGSATVNQSLTAENIKDADVVTIMLGINDFNHAVKDGIWQGKQKYDESVNYYGLGDINSTDTSEFYGAVRSWCEKIAEFRSMEEFKDTHFIFITMPISSYNLSVSSVKDWDQEKLNVHGHTLRQYCTAIMEVCAEYDIPVFDANMFSGIYYNSPEDNNVDVTGGDGVHINAAGHALLAESLAEFLLGGYSYEERAVANCGHSYVDEVVAPSCEEEGYTVHKCPECHNRYIDSYVPAAGHIFESGICTACGAWEHPMGDINLDGSVDVKDAYYARLVAAKLIKPTGEQLLVGDADLDGRITALDANIIRKFVAKIIEKLPVTG
ncbi:MAG: hypothetical protein IJA17_09650 [Oscillospiraceae bacterium]|nr:hypothetical protein [Oscillospiraceae bacterium]